MIQKHSLSWLITIDNNKNCSTSNIMEMKKGKALTNCNLMEQSKLTGKNYLGGYLFLACACMYAVIVIH